MCCGNRVATDGKCEWSIDKDYARNVLILGFDNSASYHVDNLKISFLVLGEGDTFGIIGSSGGQEKDLVLILPNQTQSFARVYIIMLTIVICCK